MENNDFLSAERFVIIQTQLFSEFILKPLNRVDDEKKYGYRPLSYLRVIPKKNMPLVDVMIAREKNKTTYWDDPVSKINHKDVELIFIDLFDWNTLGFRDFEYIRTEIIAFSNHDDLIGRQLLIRASEADVKYYKGEKDI
jgi:hypothetical protein